MWRRERMFAPSNVLPPGFKRDAVTVALHGDLSLMEVAIDFRVAEETARRWRRQAAVDGKIRRGDTSAE